MGYRPKTGTKDSFHHSTVQKYYKDGLQQDQPVKTTEPAILKKNEADQKKKSYPNRQLDLDLAPGAGDLLEDAPEMPDRKQQPEKYRAWLLNHIDALKASGMSWVEITEKLNRERIRPLRAETWGRGNVSVFHKNAVWIKA